MTGPLSDLIIPVEIKTREFVAKILFACFAAERGHRVHLGKQQTLYERVVPSLSPSVIVEHDVVASHKIDYPILKKLGHAIVAWDEEAIAQPNGEWYVARRVSPDVLAMTEAYYSWGQEQADWITRAYPSAKPTLRITGNPRIDVLRPEFSGIFRKEADEYAKRFGSYILINSNFNRVNLFPHLQRESFIRMVVADAGLTSEWESFYRGFLDHAEKTFHAYLAILPVLAARYYGRQIIIRPHPAENPEPWVKAAAGLSNVHVLFEGTANGWLAGAAALIHSGCTTAIEGAILGTSVIEFMPNANDRFDLQLPRLISHKAVSQDEVFALLDACLGGGAGPSPSANPAHPIHRHLAHLNGRFASEEILDLLSEVRPTRGHLTYRAYRRVRMALDRVSMWCRRKPAANGNRYSGHKFPPTPVEEVQAIIGDFAAGSGRFGGVRVTPTVDNCYLIDQARP